MKYLIIIVLVFLILFFVNKFISRFKSPKIGSLAVFTGAIKSGKSGVSLAVAWINFKRIHRAWKLNCFFIKFFNVFRKKNKQLKFPEEPLFYSNIKLRGFKFCELKLSHLLRHSRFNFKSVVFIDEASLVADSQLIKDGHINTQLLLFFKLFGHSTHGGKCIVNSQSMSDLHYSLKRCTSQFFYVHHLTKWIPFFVINHLREERYSDDGLDINTYNEDVEKSLVRFIMFKSVFRKYDCFSFSSFTDNLPRDNKYLYYGKKDSLKSDKIVSFRPDFANLEAFKPLKKDYKKDNGV